MTLLEIIENNARLSIEELAAMTGQTVPEAARELDGYKQNGIIRGTRTLIDWEQVGRPEAGCRQDVQAIIEVRVSPKRGRGFDEVAQAIAQLDEVQCVLLMSGGYDLAVTVAGASFQAVALFVAQRLSPMDDVLSTATHFVLKTFKKDGALYGFKARDERENAMV